MQVGLQLHACADSDDSWLSFPADTHARCPFLPHSPYLYFLGTEPGKCGHAAEHNVDDVGFIALLLDRLETWLDLDTRRIYATGAVWAVLRLAWLFCSRPALVDLAASPLQPLTTSTPALH